MKQFQIFTASLMTILLLSGTTGLEGCSAKESTSANGAQQPASSPAPDPSAQQAQAAPNAQPAPANQGEQQPQLPEVNLTAAGLDELLAPIALYPDPVLAVMMQAAVDPQEVMDGGNWLALDQNANLKEAALDEASKKAGFTPVLQALLHYPTVVDLMCTQFDWTKQLGSAYQGSPKAVLDSVQRLRAQAVDTGALKSSPQMSVDIKQDQGQQVVELKPTDPKVVYVPQYNPDQVYSSTTTTSTSGGTTTTTTTTTGTPPVSTNSNTTTVVQQKSGVSTESAVLIGLLSFGAGIALGAAINNNNYYYPAWGYGGVYYGPRPYYPPPYRPVYYPGYGGGYHYNRPGHYGNKNVNINVNNNYYNRFNNNTNLNSNYKPKPVPYNNRPNSTYAQSMGNRPGGNQGATYRPSNNANRSTRPATGTAQTRPGGANASTNPGTAQRPAAGNNGKDWKGQSTYQGNNKAGNQPANGSNMQGRPSTMPGNTNAGANKGMNPGNTPARNPSGDRGFGQAGGTRPSTGNTPATRPNTGNPQTSRPSNGNPSTSRPATTNQPSARPAPSTQQTSRPQSSSGGAFGGASNAKADRAASNRGHASMSQPASRPSGGATRKR